MDKMWKVAGDSHRQQGTNSSMNMNDWSIVELQNFVKWFMEVNHPEAVEQYQAIRDIERKVEVEEQLKAYREEQKVREQLLQARIDAMRNQTDPRSIYGPWGTVVTPEDRKVKSFWERAKEMAGIRKTEHGDYY